VPDGFKATISKGGLSVGMTAAAAEKLLEELLADAESKREVARERASRSARGALTSAPRHASRCDVDPVQRLALVDVRQHRRGDR
jgi:hypothetical protein